MGPMPPVVRFPAAGPDHDLWAESFGPDHRCLMKSNHGRLHQPGRRFRRLRPMGDGRQLRQTHQRLAEVLIPGLPEDVQNSL